MSKVFIQPGNRITWTNNTGSTVPSGGVVFVGDMPGIAQTDILDGAAGELETEGVQRLKKHAGLAITQGNRLYWDGTAKEITKTVTDKLIGTAWKSELAGGTTVDLKLGDTGLLATASTFDQMAYLAPLTDNSGGVAADGTIAAVTDGTTSANAVKELATRVNAITASLIANGFMAAS